MEDVHYNISSAIEDVLSLINYCSTDSNARRLCSTRSFWENQFNRFNLPLAEDVYYTDAYDWIQLLLKTKHVMEELHLLNRGQWLSLKVNIPILNMIDIIEKEMGVVIRDLRNYVGNDYNDEFMTVINDYPLIIDEIMILKEDQEYYLSLIISKNIENLPGGTEILQNYVEVVFLIPLDKTHPKNFIINLIPYL